MAHLLEHMLFKGTPKKFKDLKKELTEHGADANGTTWFDRTNYFETLPATDDEPGVGAFASRPTAWSTAIIGRRRTSTPR